MLPFTALTWKSFHRAMFSAKREIGWTVWQDSDEAHATDREGHRYVLRMTTHRNWRGRLREEWRWVPEDA